MTAFSLEHCRSILEAYVGYFSLGLYIEGILDASSRIPDPDRDQSMGGYYFTIDEDSFRQDGYKRPKHINCPSLRMIDGNLICRKSMPGFAFEPAFCIIQTTELPDLISCPLWEVYLAFIREWQMRGDLIIFYSSINDVTPSYSEVFVN